MTAPAGSCSAGLVFAGSHLLLGLPLRDRLVRRLGEQAFVALFSGVAALLRLLAVLVAIHGGQGPEGTGLREVPAARIGLAALAFAGLVLAMAGIVHYARSPMALFRTHIHQPSGIERITRHAFFVGISVFAIAHALIAPTLAIARLLRGLRGTRGAWACPPGPQAPAKWGAPYAEYLSVTSAVPGSALLPGPAGHGHLARVLGKTLAWPAAIAGLLLLRPPAVVPG